MTPSATFELLGAMRDAIIAALGPRAGVRGLFSGLRQRGGYWVNEPVLSVRVERKLPLEALPPESRLPSRLGELPGMPEEVADVALDVLAHGEPRLHRFDHTDRIKPQLQTWRGHSSISLLFKDSGKTFGLASGHGVLPLEQGRFVREVGASVRVVAEDAAEYAGRVIAAKLSRRIDLALVEFDPTAVPPDTYHLAAQAEPPLKLRLDDPQPGEELFHWSRLGARGLRRGMVAGVGLAPIELTASHGERIDYAVVLHVAGDDPTEPFSIPGDSGSLVVDAERRVIGTVVGGAPEQNISYVLPLPQHATKQMIGEGNYASAFTF